MVSQNKGNLTQQTATRLREMIASSALSPGDPFATEAQLEAKLGVSRSVLREAVSRLRALGLLESRQGIGLIVGKPNPLALFEQAFDTWVTDLLDLQELAELRYALEVGAVELAARRASQQQLAELESLAEQFAQHLSGAADLRPYDDIELDFHRTILEAAHNTLLMRMHRVITAYFHRAVREIPDWPSYHESSVWEHRAIAQALGERSVERARALLAGHLSRLLAPRSEEDGGI